ncbi:MAG TPA: HAMP domain-containing sensor histidine kinase [Polyangiaceae bacterium]
MHTRFRWFSETRTLFGFVGAFAIIALAFIASSFATLYTARSIDVAAKDLLTNALPSVTELMRARTAQRRLDVDVDLLGRMRDTPVELVDELVSARAELDTALAAAMATPYYPGERELYEREVQPRVATLDRAIDGLHAAVANPGGGRALAALAAVTGAARELDGGLAALAELNQAYGYDAANRVVSSRSLVARLTLFLDVASFLVAAIAAAIALHGGRRFAEKAAEALDRERDRAAELDVLAQRVAHDLMSPLATVALSLASVERACPDPQTTRVLDRARRALERSRQMVHGIYAFSGSGARPVPGASAPLRETLLEATDELLAGETQAPPTVDVQPFDEVFVAMDRAVLGVVVNNLLSNAFKFTRDSAVRRVAVRVRAEDRCVRVEVEDTGPGVPAGLEASIFEPYHRAPGVTQPGLGLGLATVKRLVLAHGGKLGVRNTRTGGAVFWFDVPRAPQEHAVAEAHPGDGEQAQAHPLH